MGTSVLTLIEGVGITLDPNPGASNVTISCSISKADIGLGNVNNTSDLDKPVSNLMQTALNSKADKEVVVNALLLTAPWVVRTGCTPRFFKDSSGIVRLEGRVSGGNKDSVIGVLPVGFRPLHERDFIVTCIGGGVLHGLIHIQTNGNVYLSESISAATPTWVALDGISFLAEQ